MSGLGAYVRILGRGPGRSRGLSRDEASEAMRLMLQGAAPEAVGALLMLLRMKGETPEEIAGFAAALPRHEGLAADLDWPSYAAGRTRGRPYFLLSARLVAQAGFRVLLHGWNGPDGSVRAGLDEAGIAMADDPGDAARRLDRAGIVYLPLESAAPGLFDLLALREVLGLRSAMNTVARMANPGAAAACVQGVFHPSYRGLQSRAAALLGWRALSVIKGGGGEFERNPAKTAVVFGLRDGRPWQGTLPPMQGDLRGPGAGIATPALSALWQGEARDRVAEAQVLCTAALALDTLGAASPETLAAELWSRRGRARAA